MSANPERSPADAALAARLDAFFRSGADPWERLEVPLPPQVFGLASNRDFSRYLEGASRVPVRSVDDICAWLRQCETVADAALFFESDFWQHPVTFEQVRKGDCEDHALWAWRQLRSLGYPTLFVAGLWRGIPHAWVIWRDSRGEHLLECTAKNGPLHQPVGRARGDYHPALAVDESLRTYVFQGYPRFHAAHPRGGVAACPPDFEVAILAGGRSSRMGRDKTRIRIGTRTLLGHVRAAAAALGRPVRVIRRDAVPACGPLGGVLTALQAARARASRVLFLSADMPEVTPALLARLTRPPGPRTRAVFAEAGGRIGFPFVVSTHALPAVRELHAGGGRSLRDLAAHLRARRIRIPRRDLSQLLNINTPGDLAELRQRRRATAPSPRSARPRNGR